MEAKYYVATRPRTDEMHGIHKEGCPFLENDEKGIFLGTFKSGYDAETAGLRHFSKTKCCAFCAKEHQAAEPFKFFAESHFLLTEENAFFCSIN
jgi:hypothetical protein